MIIGGYTLDLYCDKAKIMHDPIHTFDEFPHQFTGHTHSQCVKQARDKGWLLGRKMDLCPKCSGKGSR